MRGGRWGGGGGGGVHLFVLLFRGIDCLVLGKRKGKGKIKRKKKKGKRLLPRREGGGWGRRLFKSGVLEKPPFKREPMDYGGKESSL